MLAAALVGAGFPPVDPAALPTKAFDVYAADATAALSRARSSTDDAARRLAVKASYEDALASVRAAEKQVQVAALGNEISEAARRVSEINVAIAQIDVRIDEETKAANTLIEQANQGKEVAAGKVAEQAQKLRDLVSRPVSPPCTRRSELPRA